MNKVLGLYHRKIVDHYGDSGANDSEYLLATDESEDALRDRWNAKQKQHCIDYGYGSKKYQENIPPPFIGGVFMTYPGSTSGGCALVSNVVEIMEVPQWDRK